MNTGQPILVVTDYIIAEKALFENFNPKVLAITK